MEMKQTQQRARYLERIQAFRLMDDDFMRLVFADDPEATAVLLRAFLDRDDIEVLRVTSQMEIKGVSGRSVRLDIYAVDGDGKHYDIEIQREDRGAGERRARFHSSMMDTRLLGTGEELDTLPDTWVIFITERDVRGLGKPIYRFRRFDEETGEPFEDGTHILYVNGAYQNEENPIGRLMHDFRCIRADEMHNPVLAEKVRYFKETEGGQSHMCKIMEEMLKEEAMRERASIVKKMFQKGNSVEVIADILDTTVEEVQKLIQF